MGMGMGWDGIDDAGWDDTMRDGGWEWDGDGESEDGSATGMGDGHRLAHGLLPPPAGPLSS